MDKEYIRKNFSRYARYYDEHSTIQDLSASRLISKVRDNGFGNILDIGCGTGNYTRLLKEKFPQASIKAIDISDEMIKIAERKLKGESIEFTTRDGETIAPQEKFDLISSNATFQWFENLEETLTRYKTFLNKNAVISFSIFGPQTFYELNSSLKEVFGKEISTSSRNFIDRGPIKEILEQLFNDIEMEEEIYTETYDSLKRLLERIRYTGTRGNGTNGKGFWTPKMIDNLERVYRKGFKDIIATYQIFYCKGVK